LRANGLRILDDGVMLKSQANLFASNIASWTPELRSLSNRIAESLGAFPSQTADGK
jgi:ATP phosphoribosyltransferase